MQPRNVTSEERLLRLIESGETGARKFVFWDMRTWPGLFVPFKERAQRPARVRFAAGSILRALTLERINRGLIVIFVSLLAGIALNMNGAQSSVKDLSSQVGASRPRAGAGEPSASLRPLEDYVSEAEKRDLFSLVPPSKPEKPEATAAPVKRSEPVQPPKPAPLEILREKAKTLKVVGIAWGETPVAMIEDTTTRETFFLKALQSIHGIRVKAVLKDRVILSYENAEYDLF